jgi:putative peptidoglycan lipid II flippase
VSGWIEFLLLRRALHRRIGAVAESPMRIVKLWAAALLAAGVGYGLKRVLPFHHAVLVGVCVLGAYGVLYLAASQMLGISTIRDSIRALRRR